MEPTFGESLRQFSGSSPYIEHTAMGGRRKPIQHGVVESRPYLWHQVPFLRRFGSVRFIDGMAIELPKEC